MNTTTNNAHKETTTDTDNKNRSHGSCEHPQARRSHSNGQNIARTFAPPSIGPFIGCTQNGKRIHDRPNSHSHLSRVLLVEAISKIEVNSDEFIMKTVEMGRVVGKSISVTTTPIDQIVYARRKRREGHTRFVLNRQPEDCSRIFLILKRINEPDTFILITAYIGDQSEPEPWDKNATQAAVKFWQNQALVWGSEPIIEGTETQNCPWRTRSSTSCQQLNEDLAAAQTTLKKSPAKGQV
ncbi:MAG TPA: hypothetical protein VNV15_06380 [Opitutaceae bacterium]|jgi:hypothetical protein|nr:hypothetical protein [Opitutaceae bacterium]